jgi:CRISPR/Cas system CMR subunit Cmr4 (Cas7 group RAMP superfamily)
MYRRAYGVIEALAPVHVGATAGEETGNLNLIFRDQFTQTGIIPGSSIRGRFRADMRGNKAGEEQTWYGHESVMVALMVARPKPWSSLNTLRLFGYLFSALVSQWFGSLVPCF